MEFSARVGMVVLVLLLAGLFVENLRNFSAQHLATLGSQDLATLGARCAPFVARELPPAPPSEDCCNAGRGADLVSVCGRITPEIENMISMQKVVDVASRCGKPIPSGTKCGSFTGLAGPIGGVGGPMIPQVSAPPVSYPPPAAPGMPGQPPSPLPRPPMPQMAARPGMPPPMPGGPGMPPPRQPPPQVMRGPPPPIRPGMGPPPPRPGMPPPPGGSVPVFGRPRPGSPPPPPNQQG
ncbi:hypothetical protein EJ110_NYTH00648 [Nymphaea thermarum]|nr:hypothetical protein EJ110_NYTH00648 [Nymphaea thermarum]